MGSYCVSACVPYRLNYHLSIKFLHHAPRHAGTGCRHFPKIPITYKLHASQEAANSSPDLNHDQAQHMTHLSGGQTRITKYLIPGRNLKHYSMLWKRVRIFRDNSVFHTETKRKRSPKAVSYPAIQAPVRLLVGLPRPPGSLLKNPQRKLRQERRKGATWPENSRSRLKFRGFW